MKKYLSDIIDSRADVINNLSDRIWEYAEMGFKEYRSSAALIEVLKEEGFEVTEKLDGIDTAFSGRYGKGHPVIGILGEFDALDGLSQKAGVAYKEPVVKGDPGHGCGHNLLGAGSIAAAIAVKEYIKEHKVDGTIIYYGTPAEEGGSGKTFLARDGIFDEVDAAITWHPFFMNQVRTRSSLAVIQGRFTFHGKSAHASAAPFLGRSALDAVELMSVGTQYMREHIPDSARIHSAIVDSGGVSPNTVPARAQVVYLCRDKSTPSAMAVYEWLCQIAEGAARMTQTTVDIELESACSNVVNNRVLEELMEQCMFSFEQEPLNDEELAQMQELYDTYQLDDELLRRLSKQYGVNAEPLLLEHMHDPFYDFPVPRDPGESVNTASTDVGDVSWVCPTVQMSGATWAAWSPGHAWQNVAQGKSGAAHKGTLFAGKVMALTAVRLLNDHSLLEKAREEWKQRVGSKGYVCPIAADIKPREL